MGRDHRGCPRCWDSAQPPSLWLRGRRHRDAHSDACSVPVLTFDWNSSRASAPNQRSWSAQEGQISEAFQRAAMEQMGKGIPCGPAWTPQFDPQRNQPAAESGRHGPHKVRLQKQRCVADGDYRVFAPWEGRRSPGGRNTHIKRSGRARASTLVPFGADLWAPAETTRSWGRRIQAQTPAQSSASSYRNILKEHCWLRIGGNLNT